MIDGDMEDRFYDMQADEAKRFQAYIETLLTSIRAYGPGYAWWWVLDAKDSSEGFLDSVSKEQWNYAWESLWSEPNVFSGSAVEWCEAGYNKKCLAK